MLTRPPGSTRTDPLVPDTTLFRARRDDAKSGRCRELLQRLGGLGSARMGRQQGADFLDHRQGGGRRYGFTENRRTIFTQEQDLRRFAGVIGGLPVPGRSEEHTSELQSLMRISYAVFCLKKKKINTTT